MNQKFFQQAELALAAYGSFALEKPADEELEDADFSISQSNLFIQNFRVVD